MKFKIIISLIVFLMTFSCVSDKTIKKGVNRDLKLCNNSSECFENYYEGCAKDGICKLKTGMCRSSLSCSNGEECNREHKCIVPSCETSSDCIGGVCANGKCLPILNTANSKGKGECVESDPQACMYGQECLNGSCVDMKSSECETTNDCKHREICSEGKCIPLSNNINEAECEEEDPQSCMKGQECIDGSCVAMKSSDCDTSFDCKNGDICANGKCIVTSSDGGAERECEEDEPQSCMVGQKCLKGKCVTPSKIHIELKNCKSNQFISSFQVTIYDIIERTSENYKINIKNQEINLFPDRKYELQILKKSYYNSDVFKVEITNSQKVIKLKCLSSFKIIR